MLNPKLFSVCTLNDSLIKTSFMVLSVLHVLSQSAMTHHGRYCYTGLIDEEITLREYRWPSQWQVAAAQWKSWDLNQDLSVITSTGADCARLIFIGLRSRFGSKFYRYQVLAAQISGYLRCCPSRDSNRNQSSAWLLWPGGFHCTVTTPLPLPLPTASGSNLLSPLTKVFI